ncbi:MAG: ABC transporter ATP-binding protein [Stenotrophobium sp.]
MSTLLEVENLNVSFTTPDGVVRAVNGLSFVLGQGETLGVAGESGSGKSQTAMAVMGLLARNAKVSGSIRFDGRELLGLTAAQMNAIRGCDIGMIFQDPMTSLNPYLRIGPQMAEVLVQHRGMGMDAALAASVQMLEAVHMPDAHNRLRQYPHEISGGQRQRVMIAMTLLCKPRLLIADEPTTALDVTIQAQIIDLLAELRRELGLAILLITHDLGVVAELCERTLVMYAGQVMEQGTTARLLSAPSHPYTRGLVLSRPGQDMRTDADLPVIPGAPPDLTKLPAGCPFQPRCGHALPVCAELNPPLRESNGVQRACHVSLG